MTLKKIHLWAWLVVCVAVPAFAQNIAVVNGTPIPKAQADVLIKQFTQQGVPANPAQLRRDVRENLINSEVLTQEAIRQGLLARPDVKAQIAIAQKGVLLQALIEDFVKRNQPTDAEIHARYNQLAQATNGNEYHLHHILVGNEQQAKDLIARLKAGANFEALAKQYSKDAGSAQNGGDLSWMSQDTLKGAPEIISAVAPLKKGQITDVPVHTQYGWHIVRVDDIRPLRLPPLEQVRDRVAQQLIREKLQTFEDNLLKRAKVR